MSYRKFDIVTMKMFHKHKIILNQKHFCFIAAVLFYFAKRYNMEFYMNKDKSIMCPNCRKFLTKADSKDPRIHKLACRHCHKWIWYVPNDDDYFEIREVPNSRSSSGMTFY